MAKYIDVELIKSTQSLYSDIDSCIDELLKARVEHNQENEGKALFRMEGLMVGTLQQLSCIIDSLQQEQPEDLSSLIAKAQSVAKRLLDSHSFYEALPEDIRYEHTAKKWRKILKAISSCSQQEQQEVDLEKFTEKMNAWKARYSHPDNIPIKATMAFTARMFYMYPQVAREWYDSLPKVSLD